MGEPNQQALSTNQKIVNWGRGNLGTKIGRGECWDLGEEALKQAGAYTSNDLGPVKPNSNYVWGDLIKDVKGVEPGDILQIRDHVVKTLTVTEYKFRDGSTITTTQETTAKRGHHTAIVNAKMDANGAVKTLEQHVRPKGDVVQNMVLYTRDIPAVETKSSEKQKHPRTQKIETAEATKKVTIKVTGTIWPYRPKPK
jgi:hypothetical protein